MMFVLQRVHCNNPWPNPYKPATGLFIQKTDHQNNLFILPCNCIFFHTKQNRTVLGDSPRNSGQVIICKILSQSQITHKNDI